MYIRNFISASRFTPLRAPAIDIHPNARWRQHGLIVAGGNGEGDDINQLSYPWGLFVDDEQTIYVADQSNHRVMLWRRNATCGQVIAGGNRSGNKAHQLCNPRDVIMNKKTGSLIICDNGNERIVQWSCQNEMAGKVLISHILCVGVTMDEDGYLYVANIGEDDVRRYRRGESRGRKVAGGNGRGNRLDQLHGPQYVFIDEDRSLYVSEWGNDRVTKWLEGAKEGIVVAGGRGRGSSFSQLSCPRGVVVDQLGTVYVADAGNARIMRWPKGATEGSVVIGGNGWGKRTNQLHGPVGLSFDKDGNLYVVDNGNHRILKYDIVSNS